MFPHVPSPYDPVPTVDELREVFRKATPQEACDYIQHACGEVFYLIKKHFGVINCPGPAGCDNALQRQERWKKRHREMTLLIIRGAVKDGRIPEPPAWPPPAGWVAEVKVNGTTPLRKRRPRERPPQPGEDRRLTLERWLRRVNPRKFVDLARCPCQGNLADQELLPDAAHKILDETGSGERPSVTTAQQKQPAGYIPEFQRGANGQDERTGSFVPEPPTWRDPPEEEEDDYFVLLPPSRPIAEILAGPFALWAAEMVPLLTEQISTPEDWQRCRGPIEAVDKRWRKVLDPEDDDADDPLWDVRILNDRPDPNDKGTAA